MAITKDDATPNECILKSRVWIGRPAWVESMTQEQQLVMGRPHQRQKDYGTGVPAFPARLTTGQEVDGSTGRVLATEETNAKL